MTSKRDDEFSVEDDSAEVTSHLPINHRNSWKFRLAALSLHCDRFRL